MIDRIGLVHTETKIEFLGPIWLSEVSDENHTRQRYDWLYKCVLFWKETELSWLIGLGTIYDENQIEQQRDISDWMPILMKAR